MTQENYQKKAIKEYLDALGVFHFYLLQGLGAYKGAPDMIACRKGEVFAIEVKDPIKGRQSDYQKEFQRDWEAHGGNYIIGGIDAVMEIIK